ncbi:GNAT family N-acetyltransferase [Formosa sediminum]|uniref:GNAT family N-acetyltransferase n=1 Tax=Formosa sediminum TaxID=2594004 RepID=A0A516GT89_9FLAO|nr:GNAT family protein [Formosa sediminum]QDO94722.1 GNAT family N-acetyltransferase [Formosa sediminum]
MNIQQLEDSRVKLTLLDLSNYKSLIPIAKQEDLVKYSPTDIATEETLKNYVQTALDGYYHNTCIPFLVFDKSKNAYAGCTRFMNINAKQKVLDIGSTWIGYEFHGTGLNAHMKFLMLQYAFERLEYERVEFKVDERNIRSRKAIEGIGGTLEGILRQNLYLLDGYKRNTCIYGILKAEWDVLKTTVFKDFKNSY